jgi:hypothetical protein
MKRSPEVNYIAIAFVRVEVSLSAGKCSAGYEENEYFKRSLEPAQTTKSRVSTATPLYR